MPYVFLLSFKSTFTNSQESIGTFFPPHYIDPFFKLNMYNFERKKEKLFRMFILWFLFLFVVI
uniref:Uncharacterized protein n=1 Tax=Anguilla anguilla TaxID=7936 RepID=A0A0E9WK90_ANGAN